MGCDENSYCTEPMEKVNFYSLQDAIALKQVGSGIPTDCKTFEGAIELVRQSSKMSASQPRFGLIEVQSVANADIPARSFLEFLPGQNKRIELGGWDVTFFPAPTRPAGPFPKGADANIHPQQLPMNGLALADRHRTATVVLPESDGPNQYVVTVPESATHPVSPHRYSVLLTREWLVLLLRDPIPDSADAPAKSKSPCGGS
jgi:hypothetical protein